jgi:hypothetical protein
MHELRCFAGKPGSLKQRIPDGYCQAFAAFQIKALNEERYRMMAF